MALTYTPAIAGEERAQAFSLPATDGKTYGLEDVRGEKGLLVAFICNHCPYVKAVIARLVEDAAALQAAGIGVAAIMSNDTQAYPDDSFDNMKAFAQENGFTFPYLLDETQEVARAYGAVCTPDFFGYDAGGRLKYRGRLDETNPSHPATPDTRRELREAMLAVAQTGEAPADQTPSMGCNIKWRKS